MLRDVYVYGAPGKRFGRHFRISIATPREAFRALESLRPGSRQVFRQGFWRIIVGRPHIANSTTELDMNLGSQPLHIVPATRPHGGDVGKVAAGVVIIGAAIALSPFTGGASFGAAMATGILGSGITFGSVALMGGAMLLGGLASMLSPRPSVQQGTQQAIDFAKPEDRPSYLFNGAVNNTQQGGPVPVVFGLHLTGSIVISAGLTAENIP